MQRSVNAMQRADGSRRGGRVKNAIIDVHYRGSNLTQCGRSKMCMIKFPFRLIHGLFADDIRALFQDYMKNFVPDLEII